MRPFRLLLAFVCAVLLASPAKAFLIQEPSLDYFDYKHALGPGTRSAASVWGAVGDADLDDRAAQFLVRFDTSAVAAPGKGASSYQITSLTLTLTVNLGDSFRYDPTFDPLGSYFSSSDVGYVADVDLGRPIELFAVGYSNGYTAKTFTESTAYSSGGVRNAYAAGFNGSGQLIDVSNNVAGGFEVTPLAVGQIAGLSAGSYVPEDALMTFNINVTDPAMLAWLQNSLNAGYLEFMVTSLQPSEQLATSGFASFYTKENVLHDPAYGDYVAAQLGGVVTVAVPEPGVLWLLALGAVAAPFVRKKRHA